MNFMDPLTMVWVLFFGASVIVGLYVIYEKIQELDK